MPDKPPVLLTAGQYYGTLAAVRCLGRAGVPVTMAEGHALAPARWSRYVAHRVRCPDLGDTEAFLSWLLDFGASHPGHVLLPASDDGAWLFAESRDALSARFRMLPTSFAAVDALLDKHALHDHCEGVGIDVPETWFPRTAAEAAALAAEAGPPLLFKPRTQVLHPTGDKGALLDDLSGIEERFDELSEPWRYGERLRRKKPDVVLPMLQRYYPESRDRVYSLSGYAGRGGDLLAARAARKILQRPRKFGTGLCFAEADVEPRLSSVVEALCRRLGYQGVFEAEFVEVGSRALLIDFNPRFYGQMAFDIDRGMPLPLMAYADALGDAAELSALSGRRDGAAGNRVYCHRALFEVMLRAQALSGQLGPIEQERWRSWWGAHRRLSTDAVADRDDPLPFGVDVASQLTWLARHPRSFVRSMTMA